MIGANSLQYAALLELKPLAGYYILAMDEVMTVEEDFMMYITQGNYTLPGNSTSPGNSSTAAGLVTRKFSEFKC